MRRRRQAIGQTLAGSNDGGGHGGDRKAQKQSKLANILNLKYPCGRGREEFESLDLNQRPWKSTAGKPGEFTGTPPSISPEAENKSQFLGKIHDNGRTTTGTPTAHQDRIFYRLTFLIDRKAGDH
jgi:hypothetical protein